MRDGQRWDLSDLERLDALGFEEAWIGEHFTATWEPCPAPDLLIAQALLRTKQIRLGPLGHLLPYHHPVDLAHRVAYLDHMAEGRYQLGVGIGVLPTDHDLFGHRRERRKKSAHDVRSHRDHDATMDERRPAALRASSGRAAPRRATCRDLATTSIRGRSRIHRLPSRPSRRDRKTTSWPARKVTSRSA